MQYCTNRQPQSPFASILLNSTILLAKQLCHEILCSEGGWGALLMEGKAGAWWDAPTCGLPHH